MATKPELREFLLSHGWVQNKLHEMALEHEGNHYRVLMGKQSIEVLQRSIILGIVKWQIIKKRSYKSINLTKYEKGNFPYKETA